MCLKSNRLIPYIAEKDIKVFKAIVKKGDGFVTSFWNYPVKLGEMLIPSETHIYDKMECNNNNHQTYVSIQDGYIHAYFDKRCFYLTPFFDSLFVESFIPKGTRYYIDMDLDTICAEKLFITDRFIGFDDICLSKEEEFNVLKPLYEEIASKGVSSGWLVKSDKSFISPLDYDDGMLDDIIGIVGFIRKREKYVISLRDLNTVWYVQHRNCFGTCVVDIYKDYNGKEYTENVRKHLDNSNQNFSAFEMCLEYQTKNTNKGDWYLPSSGELYEALCKNHVEMNAALYRLFSDTFSSAWLSYLSSTDFLGGEIKQKVYNNPHTIRLNETKKFVRAFLRI